MNDASNEYCLNLPKDANGRVLCIGDYVKPSRPSLFLSDAMLFSPGKVVGYYSAQNGELGVLVEYKDEMHVKKEARAFGRNLAHCNAPDIDEVLREFGERYERLRSPREKAELRAEYATKLRLVDA